MNALSRAKESVRLIILDDVSPLFPAADSITDALEGETSSATLFADPEAFINAVKRVPPAVTLVNLDKFADHEAGLSQLVSAAPKAIIITASAHGNLSRSINVMRLGAHEFLIAPVALAVLTSHIDELLRHRQRRSAPDFHPTLTDAALSLGQKTAPPIPSGDPELPISPPNESIAPLWAQEREIIENALKVCNGNITLAAAALEISPSTIYRKKQSWAEKATNNPIIY